MNALLIAILVSVIIVLGFQIVVPFPFGLIFGVGIAAIIIWYTRKTKSINPFSLLTHKRVDPQNEDEEKQNREAYRILKKQFLDGEITKEEFDRLREPFGDLE